MLYVIKINAGQQTVIKDSDDVGKRTLRLQLSGKRPEEEVCGCGEEGHEGDWCEPEGCRRLDGSRKVTVAIPKGIS